MQPLTVLMGGALRRPLGLTRVRTRVANQQGTGGRKQSSGPGLDAPENRQWEKPALSVIDTSVPTPSGETSPLHGLPINSEVNASPSADVLYLGSHIEKGTDT